GAYGPPALPLRPLRHRNGNCQLATHNRQPRLAIPPPRQPLRPSHGSVPLPQPRLLSRAGTVAPAGSAGVCGWIGVVCVHEITTGPFDRPAGAMDTTRLARRKL